MRTSSGRKAKPCTEPTKCRSCYADVLWVIWPQTGRWMPVDAEPDARPLPKGGNIVLTLHGGEFGELHAEKWDISKHGQERRRYTSHFATCPNANEHRRGG